MKNLQDSPLVSVIIPNYNYAKYLHERLSSVLEQTYQNMEIILLDDASSDNSVSVMEECRSADLRIREIIRNEKNSGSPFRQWKKGLDMAKGEYIWIAEADDLADSKFIESTLELLEKYPSASMAFTGSVIIDKNGKETDADMDSWTARQKSNPDGYKVFHSNDYVRRNLYWYNYVYNASGVLFRRSAYLKVSDTEWAASRYCGDWRFWTRIAQQGDVIEIYRKLNRFRKHSDSVTVNSLLSDTAFEACMRESFGLTSELEDTVGVPCLDKVICHGHYYKLFRNRKINTATRDRLMTLLSGKCRHPRLAYHVWRVNKTLSKIFPNMDRMRAERCV